MSSLADYRDIHSGDIWVLGSGPTLTYINPAFFDSKIVIATNRIAERLDIYKRPNLVYTHSHYHHEDLHSLVTDHPWHTFFGPEGDQGFAGSPTWTAPNMVYYPHKPTVYDFTPDNAYHEDGLIVGSTSIHGSMHLAAHMGADNIILVGADCGIMDGHTNHTGYTSGNLITDDTRMWLARWNTHLEAMKAWLINRYNVNIYSLNPFVNLNLEGHTWEGVR